MKNHLARENSPYLLQHADNLVNWYPWGEEALVRARSEDKPIFLSIGYAACHWCHVMAHESFEDPETAALMNQYFINIKVDREERPDLDSLYMSATMAMTRSGGWPMSVFLTPDLEPFFTGTYFPPVPRYRMPSFKDVLTGVASAWLNNREDVLHTANQVKDYLQRSNQVEGGTSFSFESQTLNTITNHLLTSYDQKLGGWGTAPKFPQPMLVDFLIMRMLSIHENENSSRQEIQNVTEHVLTSMAKGGMYDLIGGGFARYSVDAEWLVPHFEKMLYDNAQLALTYLHGYLVTGNEQFRQVCEETLTYIQRELLDPSGGFYSSLDADSEGEEGKYYVWEFDELKQILGSEFPLFQSAYDISPVGNWEGKIIFRRVRDDQSLSEIFDSTISEIVTRLQKGLRLLFEERNQRIRPSTDDKVLVSWNGFALMAFAEAGRYLKRPDFIEIARKNANFLMKEMVQHGRLMRSWRKGVARHYAYLEDYAALMLGLIALYQSDPDPVWYQWALQLGDEMVAHFQDPEGGFYDTGDDHEQLLIRPKDIQDNATPSGNALAATALMTVAAYGDRADWRRIAERTLAIVQNKITEYPSAFGKWLQAIEYSLGNTVEIAILGNLDDYQIQIMNDAVWKKFDPFRILAISSFPPAPESPRLVKDRPMLEGKATAYVCQNFVCKTPVNELSQFIQQLNLID